MPWIQAIVGFLSAGAAGKARQDAEARAADILKRARDDFGNIDVPTLEQIMNEELGPSAVEQIKTNAKLASAQQSALDKLGEYSEGGLTLQDQATLNAAMGKAARVGSAGREAIRENMVARGTLGSGAELAMNLQNQQDSANRANQAGLDVAGKAQQRALDALLQRGQMAGQMRQQDWQENLAKAQAKDLIARYNATRKPQAYRDMFSMQYQKTAGMNGMAGAEAASARNAGNAQAQTLAALGQGANDLVGNYAAWKAGQGGSGTPPYNTGSSPTDQDILDVYDDDPFAGVDGY